MAIEHAKTPEGREIMEVVFAKFGTAAVLRTAGRGA